MLDYGAEKTNVCGAAENTAMGVAMRHVTLSVVANHLYPH